MNHEEAKDLNSQFAVPCMPLSAARGWRIPGIAALLTSGQLDVKPIIGDTWPIDQWHETFAKMHKGEVVKSVLKPM